MKRQSSTKPLLLLVPVISIVSSAAINAAEQSHSNSSHSQTAESDYQIFIVGRDTYKISKSHVLGVTRDSSGKILRVIMDAELPFLDPLPVGRTLPRDRIYNRVTIHIEARTMNFAGFLKVEGTLLKEANSLFDLREYTLFGEPTTYVPFDADYRNPVGGQIAFNCRGVAPSKDFPLASPICQTAYPVDDQGTGIYYRFYQLHLQDWRKIDIAIRRFVQSMKQ